MFNRALYGAKHLEQQIASYITAEKFQVFFSKVTNRKKRHFRLSFAVHQSFHD